MNIASHPSNTKFRTASTFTLVAGIGWATAAAVGFIASFLNGHASDVLLFLLLVPASGLAVYAATRQADHHRSVGMLFVAGMLVLAYAASMYAFTPGPMVFNLTTIGLLIVPAILAVGVLTEAVFLRLQT
jgi:hypothetical protein